jgi:ketosteroid isomerase-like protein
MDLHLRRALQNGDVALLVSDWTLTGTGADGNPTTLGGTTADVVRRQADGTWRYAIDNPLGVQGA